MIQSAKERLYESSSLRDDLNDDEATVLLGWGEAQVERLAQAYPAEEAFEQKCRFLRQLLKHLNRFVGQREFNDEAGQREYMSKAVKYLEPLGWDGITEADLMSKLPLDPTDMSGTLKAVLQHLGMNADETSAQSVVPEMVAQAAERSEVSTETVEANAGAEVDADPSEAMPTQIIEAPFTGGWAILTGRNRTDDAASEQDHLIENEHPTETGEYSSYESEE